MDVQILTRPVARGGAFRGDRRYPCPRLPVRVQKRWLDFIHSPPCSLAPLAADLITLTSFSLLHGNGSKKALSMPVVVKSSKRVLGDVRLLHNDAWGRGHVTPAPFSRYFYCLSQEIGEELSQAGIPAVRTVRAPQWRRYRTLKHVKHRKSCSASSPGLQTMAPWPFLLASGRGETP